MKFWENFYDTKSNRRIVKLLNIPIYETSFGENSRRQKILCGAIWTEKNYSTLEKNIRIFGAVSIKRICRSTHYRYYIYVPIYLRKNKKSLKGIKQYLNYIPSNYTDVFILNSCIGECFLFLNNFQKYIEKKKINNYIFVALKKSHIDLLKMLLPGRPYIHIPELFYYMNEDFSDYSKQNFHIFYEPLYFVNVENSIRKNPLGSVHFLSFILDKLEITVDDFNLQSIPVPSKEEEAVKKKAKTYGLNLDNFIFVANETTSSGEIHREFWEDIVKRLRIQGYDIYQNATNTKNLLLGAKTFGLTIKEALILAKHAKSIIMNRSGLSDVFTLSNTPMFVLYSDFKERGYFAPLSSDRVMHAFTLKKLPFVDTNKIHEYDFNEYTTKEELIKSIINDISKEEI